MLRIGPAGNSLSFYASGFKHTYQAPEYLSKMGLNAFEYSFGRGVNLGSSAAKAIKEQAEKFDVQISAHAPYYTNLATSDPEMLQKTIQYVLDSIKAVGEMGGRRVVVHPASCGKLTRDEAFDATKRGLYKLLDSLELSGLSDCLLCIETMGKHGQIGTAAEVIELCAMHKCLIPCFDFGHINSFTLGGIKTRDDYKSIIDAALNTLGDKARGMHIHFSKIMYGQKGELKHLTFADTKYGPDYAPLARLIDDYDLSPTVICESDGVMAEDALTMKKMHTSLQTQQD